MYVSWIQKVSPLSQTVRLTCCGIAWLKLHQWLAKQPVPILQETGVSEDLELPEAVAAPRPCASAHFASSPPPRMSVAAVLHGSLWADSPWGGGQTRPHPKFT